MVLPSLQALRAETMVERFTARMHVCLGPDFGSSRSVGDGGFRVVQFWRGVSAVFSAVVIVAGVWRWFIRVWKPVCILIGVVKAPVDRYATFFGILVPAWCVALVWWVVVLHVRLAVSTRFPRGNHG